HPATCEASAAYTMAAANNTGDAVKDWLFLHQDELTPAAARRAASEIGKVSDFDAKYQQVLGQIKADASVGPQLGVDSTPSFFISGGRIPEGGIEPRLFKELIDIELARATGGK